MEPIISPRGLGGRTRHDGGVHALRGVDLDARPTGSSSP